MHLSTRITFIKGLVIFAVVAWMSRDTVNAEGIPTLDRLFNKAKFSAKENPAVHLWAIREAALAEPVVSNPVSDRYLITELGGPIDLVHFLGLAIRVFKDPKVHDAELWSHYVEEGGMDYEKGRTRNYVTEAHPDDLPSNAFGALFGAELAQNKDVDVALEMTRFLRNLKPLPDSTVKRYSHGVMVMGLRGTESERHQRSRREWFTARPLLVAQFWKLVPQVTQREALRRAGFSLERIRGREIKIVRLSEGPGSL